MGIAPVKPCGSCWCKATQRYTGAGILCGSLRFRAGNGTSRWSHAGCLMQPKLVAHIFFYNRLFDG